MATSILQTSKSPFQALTCSNPILSASCWTMGTLLFCYSFSFTMFKTYFTLPHLTQISQCPLCTLLPAKPSYRLAISGTYPKLFFLSTLIQTICSFLSTFLSCLCLSKCFFPCVIYFLLKVCPIAIHGSNLSF